MNLPLLINSSDNTFDILESVYGSNIKRLKSFTGIVYYTATTREINKYNLSKITVSQTHWSDELRQALLKLDDEFIILCLDDFLFFNGLNSNKINKILKHSQTRSDQKIDYLRLKPVERQLLLYLFNIFKSFFTGDSSIKLNANEPYFSSLQLAIWRRKYLLQLLQTEMSIWDFEKIVTTGNCYAVARPFVLYKHMVEKGLWFWFAKFFLDLENSPRELHTFWHSAKHIFIRNKFYIFGYIFSRIKNR